ncbi:MAG TPA: hypothetical protein VFQ53_01310 [Kofleriaceae bacterium]|nr:hypothetical protein [Kofleriaceae bacterium]
MRVLGFVGLVGLAACSANDPIYLPSPMNLEAGVDDGTGTLSVAKSSLTLPITIEKAEDAATRAERTAALGVDVPYVKVGDIEVSVEWTIKSLDTNDDPADPTDDDDLAFVDLNGANEAFAYDPSLIVLSTDDDAPPTPPLEGNIPIHVPKGGTVSGLFREDQLREASIDLDQITRGNVNPFAATLTINKNADAFQPMTPYDPANPDVAPTPVGDPVPREAFRQLIRVDIVFRPTTHMVLEYTVRVRDVRGEMIHEDLFDAPAGELTAFAPATYSI